MLSRLVIVTAVGVLAVTGLPGESPAASAKKQCINETCKPGKKSCMSAFKGQFGTSKANCTGLMGKERSQCKKGAKGKFREDRKKCKDAFRDCKKCCKGERITACSLAVCGDGIKVAGEECDGLDDSACPSRCQANCTCLALPPTTLPPTTLPVITTTTTSSTTTTVPATASTTTTMATTTTLPFGCGLAPVDGCIGSENALLLVKETVPGKEMLRVVLNKLASATDQSQFGDPVTGSTRYTVCIYDQNDVRVGEMEVERAQQVCGTQAKPCWKAISTKGYKYNDKDTSADGILTIIAKGGDAGKGNIVILGKNNVRKGQLSLPTGIASLLQGNTKATLQVLTSDAECFGVTTTDVKKADGLLFKAFGGSPSDPVFDVTTGLLN